MDNPFGGGGEDGVTKGGNGVSKLLLAPSDELPAVFFLGQQIALLINFLSL